VQAALGRTFMRSVVSRAAAAAAGSRLRPTWPTNERQARDAQKQSEFYRVLTSSGSELEPLLLAAISMLPASCVARTIAKAFPLNAFLLVSL
jgi:hypothetical protein